MGIFGNAASQKAKHGSNLTTPYIEHSTDSGEIVFGLDSMPLKKIEKSGKQVVIVTLLALYCDIDLAKVKDPDHVIRAGDTRQIVVNLGDNSTAGSIRQQEFKSLVTALANVPLADEQAKDAVLRLVALTGEDHGLKDLDKAATAALVGARDSLIETLMEKWTAGEGKTGAGNIVATSVWPRKDKNDPTKVYTSSRHAPVTDENRGDLKTAIASGDVQIPADLAKRFGLAA